MQELEYRFRVLEIITLMQRGQVHGFARVSVRGRVAPRVQSVGIRGLMSRDSKSRAARGDYRFPKFRPCSPLAASGQRASSMSACVFAPPSLNSFESVESQISRAQSHSREGQGGGRRGYSREKDGGGRRGHQDQGLWPTWSPGAHSKEGEQENEHSLVRPAASPSLSLSASPSLSLPLYATWLSLCLSLSQFVCLSLNHLSVHVHVSYSSVCLSVRISLPHTHLISIIGGHNIHGVGHLVINFLIDGGLY